MHRNSEGYPDPTAGKAIKAAGRMPPQIYEIYKALNDVAEIHGLEITGLRDKRTRKEWKK